MSYMEARRIVERFRKDLTNFTEYENGFRFFGSLDHPEQDLVVHKVTHDVYSISAYISEYPGDFIEGAAIV